MAGKKSVVSGPGVSRGGGAPDEPGLLAQLVSEYFVTVLGIALGAAAIVGWAIYQKVHSELEVPAPLYLYLGVALAVAAIVSGLRLAIAPSVDRVNQRTSTLKESRFLVKEAHRCLGAHGARLNPEVAESIREAAVTLEEARKGSDWAATDAALKHLDQLLDQHLAPYRKSTTREYLESIVIAVLIALFLRSLVIEAFKIPSGSMIPTLQVGDHIFVNKFIYGIRVPWTNLKFGMGIRRPKRGEVIVFKFPKDQDKDFIKRIVAVEGDTVEIKDNVVWVNGQPTQHVHQTDSRCEYEDFDEVSSRWDHRRCDAWRETLGDHTYETIFDRGSPPRSWPKVTIPPANVFVMGDNRDNSHDSRFWGTVPFELIKGKAMIIWFSSGEPEALRLRRIGQLLQ